MNLPLLSNFWILELRWSTIKILFSESTDIPEGLFSCPGLFPNSPQCFKKLPSRSNIDILLRCSSERIKLSSLSIAIAVGNIDFPESSPQYENSN